MKKYIKPEAEILDAILEQQLMLGSNIEAEVSDETQDNSAALGRFIDDL